MGYRSRVRYVSFRYFCNFRIGYGGIFGSWEDGNGDAGKR